MSRPVMFADGDHLGLPEDAFVPAGPPKQISRQAIAQKRARAEKAVADGRQPGKPGREGPKRCGRCGVLGHNRRTCTA